MDQDAQLIEELGIQNLTPDQQQRIIDEVHMQLGEALAEGLNEAQLNEYQAIIDGNQDVIDAWLGQNMPDYKETEAYAQLSEGFDEDPDKVPADKVLASMAWVQKNNPNLEETAARIKQSIKQNVQSYL